MIFPIAPSIQVCYAEPFHLLSNFNLFAMHAGPDLCRLACWPRTGDGFIQLSNNETRDPSEMDMDTNNRLGSV